MQLYRNIKQHNFNEQCQLPSSCQWFSLTFQEKSSSLHIPPKLEQSPAARRDETRYRARTRKDKQKTENFKNQTIKLALLDSYPGLDHKPTAINIWKWFSYQRHFMRWKWLRFFSLHGALGCPPLQGSTTVVWSSQCQIVKIESSVELGDVNYDVS